MRVSLLGLVACVVLSTAQHQHESKIIGHQAESNGRTRSNARLPIRPRKNGPSPKPEPVHFDIFERIHFEIFERVRSSILLDPPWTFNITIGNQGQHIGGWQSALMRDQMSVAFKETCGWRAGWSANSCDAKIWNAYVEYVDKRLQVNKKRK
jgi:hypothetical protein